MSIPVNYLDPGVVVEEKIVASSATLGLLPLQLCIVGPGTLTKQAVDELIIRGQIQNEAITISATPGAHTSSALVDNSDQKKANTIVYANGKALSNSDYSFNSATQILVTDAFYTQHVGATYTITYVAINTVNDPLSKATIGGTNIKSISKVGTYPGVDNFIQNTDYQLAAGTPQTIQWIGVDTPAVVFGAPATQFNLSVNNSIRVAIDALAATTIDCSVSAAGHTTTVSAEEIAVDINKNLPTATVKHEDTDGVSNGSNLITSAGLAGSPAAGDYIFIKSDGVNYGAACTIRGTYLIVAVAGTTIEVDRVVPAKTLIKYSIFAPNKTYATTTVVGADNKNRVVLSAKVSAVTFTSPVPSIDATPIIFDTYVYPKVFASISKLPQPGTAYYVTYTYDRPASDFNTPFRVFGANSDFFTLVGDLAHDNPLSIAGQVAIENGANILWYVQVKPTGAGNTYLDSDYVTALAATDSKSDITDVVVLSTADAVRGALLNDVINQSTQVVKHYRRGWFGVARNTAIGDADTVGSIVYLARRTLLVAADSTGRGRLIVTAPPNVSKTIVESDGNSVRVDLDSNYVSVAVAALMTSFTNPSQSLTRKSIVGFNVDDFQTYSDAERKYMAPLGINVITNIGGNLKMLDAHTTDLGLVSFQAISASAQKDSVTKGVIQQLDDNVIGVVPDDLQTFIIDIKANVANKLRAYLVAGVIGQYTNADGNTRDLDPSRDIVVFRLGSDPRKYVVQFWYNLKYPVLWVFGQFSVDAPFFTVK